jgi:hypothetical protein
LRSNDLFDRANQRVVGLIGRVRMRNSRSRSAQRFGNDKLSGGNADMPETTEDNTRPLE